MKNDEFEKLTKSIKQAGRIRRGRGRPSRTFEFEPDDIKAIRQGLGKSQVEFALLIGVSPATLRNWEQGRRSPDGPARALLKVALRIPESSHELWPGSGSLANSRPEADSKGN